MEQHRKKNLFLNLLANPFALAIPLAIAVILILPDFGEKYKIEPTASRLADKSKSQVNFVDLNGDGIDEHVSGFPNITMSKAAIKVMSYDAVNYEQWNFNGELKKSSHYFHCADLDKNGLKEVYMLYHRADSLFLAAVAPYPDKEILFEDLFICSFDLIDGEIDYAIKEFRTADLDKDGYEELIFLASAGFSLQPRVICAYDAKKNEIRKSESFAANLTDLKISDLNEDGFPEIYTNTCTSNNIPENTEVPYSDYNSWLMAFDHELRFLFTPVKNEGNFSKVITFPAKDLFNEPALLALFINKNTKRFLLRKYNMEGVLLEELNLQNFFNDLQAFDPEIFLFSTNRKDLIALGTLHGKMIFTGESLSISERKIEKGNHDLSLIEDLDNDGNVEWVFLNPNYNIFIYDKHLKNPLKYDLNLRNPRQQYFCLGARNKNGQKEVFVKTDHEIFYLSYSKNPLFYFKYLVWIFVYLLMALALWFAQHLRQQQVQKRNALEATITQLQMKTIKNQMDPHFIFNVLNGIANNIHKNRNTESYNQIIRFSRLLRILMRRSDTIDVTLKEEMEFVLHYLELEKFRFKDHFVYSIDIEKDVDQQVKVPKMLVQLLVENSIKHGLHEKTGLKKVHIKILNSGKQTKIVVEDNGIGRKAAAETSPEKGKGLSLLKELTKLNREIHGQEIRIEVVDLYDKENRSSGTRVEAVLY